MVGPRHTGPHDEQDPDPGAELLAGYRVHAEELVRVLGQVLPGWVVRSVRTRLEASGRPVDQAAPAAADDAAERTVHDVLPKVRALVLTDPDEQLTNPLSLLRAATGHATAALRRLGVPEVERDEFAARQFPDDVYDLSPAAFSDLDPALHEPGIAWGAAKAHVHLVRRRAEGRR